MSLPNTANRSLNLKPGTYIAKHVGPATGNYELYETDGDGNAVEPDIGTVGLEVVDGELKIS